MDEYESLSQTTWTCKYHVGLHSNFQYRSAANHIQGHGKVLHSPALLSESPQT